MAFTVFILVVVAVSFSVLYRDISATLLAGIMEHIGSASSIPDAGESIMSELTYVNNRNLLIVGGLFLLMMLLFSYYLARVALKPTRSALSAQKQFIGNIAHELRTPLSIIKTNTEVTLLDAQVPDDIRKTLRETIIELDRTSDIINNLLSFNSFIRPEKIEFSEVNMGDIINEAMRKLSDLAERKHLSISVRKSSFLMVVGNAIALEQIVINLLKNAISYTPNDGHITITLGPDYHGFIELKIQDSGIGIARKDLFRIFEPFYRAEQSRARQYGGSGLGLAIVSELVKFHNGRIAITSAPRKGTTVTVSFPCGKTPELQIRESQIKKEFGEIEVDYSFQRTNRQKK